MPTSVPKRASIRPTGCAQVAGMLAAVGCLLVCGLIQLWLGCGMLSAQTGAPVSQGDELFGPPPLPNELGLAPAELDELTSIWLVSTRQRDDRLVTPEVRRYDQRQGWQESTLEAFHATDALPVVTLVFVHGNDNSADFAARQGLDVYRRIRSAGAGCRDIPVRFVIWSWPSDRILRPYTQDVRLKATLTDPEAFCLARFVASLHPDAPLSLVGYSYGTRVVTGALHLVAGGTIQGQGLDSLPTRRRPVRAVFMAAALEEHWLLPGSHHGRAMLLVDQALVTINHRDVALKHFPWLRGPGTGPSAVGYQGVTPGRGYECICEKLKLLDVSGLIGLRHRLCYYLQSKSIMHRVCTAALSHHSAVHDGGLPQALPQVVEPPSPILPEQVGGRDGQVAF